MHHRLYEWSVSSRELISPFPSVLFFMDSLFCHCFHAYEDAVYGRFGLSVMGEYIETVRRLRYSKTFLGGIVDTLFLFLF